MRAKNLPQSKQTNNHRSKPRTTQFNSKAKQTQTASKLLLITAIAGLGFMFAGIAPIAGVCFMISSVCALTIVFSVLDK